jgi:phosphoribosylformylglycinamidine synthase
MKRWLPLGLIAAGLIGLVYAIFFWSSDEDQIRARLAQLADTVRISDGELNPVVRHGRIRQEFAEIFVKEVRAEVSELSEGLHGRNELAAAATQVAGAYRSADVSFGGVDIRIDRSGMTADVNASATVTGAQHGQPVRRDERQVSFQFEKIDGDWKIVSLTVAARQEANDEGF